MEIGKLRGDLARMANETGLPAWMRQVAEAAKEAIAEMSDRFSSSEQLEAENLSLEEHIALSDALRERAEADHKAEFRESREKMDALEGVIHELDGMDLEGDSWPDQLAYVRRVLARVLR